MPRVHLQQGGDDVREVLAVVGGDPRILASDDLSVEALHVLGAEGRAQGDHLVQHAAERPHVALRVVRHVAPDLRGGVVGGARLRHAEAPLRHLGDVEVAELGDDAVARGAEEDVGALHVAVQDPKVVQRLQALAHPDQVAPDVSLPEVCPVLLALVYALQEVARIRALLDDAEAARLVVEKCLLVGDDVLVLDGGEQPDLVQRVLLLLVRQRGQLHLLERVDLVVGETEHLVDSRVGPLPEE
mmetsp:Transcript_50018/g.132192  ORF Transcript_50018/g.132192 Transcript_50018/m.132192 type:complete len:243 (-) Transcript_50018:76-804(-)